MKKCEWCGEPMSRKSESGVLLNEPTWSRKKYCGQRCRDRAYETRRVRKQKVSQDMSKVDNFIRGGM